MKIEKVDAPCKDCANRKVGCHSECEKYTSYKDAIYERNVVTRKALNKEVFSQKGLTI